MENEKCEMGKKMKGVTGAAKRKGKEEEKRQKGKEGWRENTGGEQKKKNKIYIKEKGISCGFI